MLVTMFSQYTDEPFTYVPYLLHRTQSRPFTHPKHYSVEPIEIISPHNSQSRQVPNLTPRATQAEVSYINECCGLSLAPAEMCKMLTRMAYHAWPSKTEPNLLEVDVPPTRADVLHQADIMEDVAIAYGFNKLPRSFPRKSGTIAQPLALNKLSDIIRLETAMAGWSEVLPLILCSHEENFGWLNRQDDDSTAVKLANPKTAEYQVIRTSLLPGLLKTLRENKKHGLPIKIFEVSDVAFKAPELERKSRNERHFAAAWYGKTSGFEVVHGLLDRIMLMLKTSFCNTTPESYPAPTTENNTAQAAPSTIEYWISQDADNATFFEGHAATIHVRVGDSQPVAVGVLGILHPTVLDNFDLRYPVSTLEVNIEVFL
jgi:phenylalanyl-tRNA synthetase beta chain